MRQTSLDAYNSIRLNGVLSDLRFECYDVLFHHGPGTATELVYAVKTEHPELEHTYLDNIDKRLSELRELGVAVELEKRMCKITGRMAIVWGVTDKMPTKLTKKEKILRQIEKTKNRLIQLQSKLSAIEKGVLEDER